MSTGIAEALAPLDFDLRWAWRRWRDAAPLDGREPDDSAAECRRASAKIDELNAAVRAVVWSGIAPVLPGLAQPDWSAGVPPLAVGTWWVDSHTIRWRVSGDPVATSIGWDNGRSMWHVALDGEGRRVFWGSELWPLLLQLEHVSPEWRGAFVAASAGGAR